MKNDKLIFYIYSKNQNKYNYINKIMINYIKYNDFKINKGMSNLKKYNI